MARQYLFLCTQRMYSYNKDGNGELLTTPPLGIQNLSEHIKTDCVATLLIKEVH